MRWLAILSACLLIVFCFFPWVIITTNRQFVATGFDAVSIGFGKPGLLHVFFSAIFILMILIGKIWSLRTAFFICAFNIAWAARNFILLGACKEGVCPVRQPAIYAMLISALLMTVLVLFADVKPKTK